MGVGKDRSKQKGLGESKSFEEGGGIAERRDEWDSWRMGGCLNGIVG